MLGWRDVPVDPTQLGPVARAVLPVDPPALHRPPPRGAQRVRAQALRHPQAGREPHPRARASIPRAASTSRSLSAETIVYKGLLLPRQLPRFYPDLRDPDMVSAIARGALALLDQHLPHLGPGAAVPLHRAQRRDQHRAGNRNWMNARRSLLQSAKFGGSLERLSPDHRAGQERLGAVRQHARAAAPRRPLAAARDDDDDPRGVGGQPGRCDDERRAFYEYTVVADGAVGRPGGDRLHRRPAGRRHARPQRPAPGALPGHRRRPRHPRLGGRRDRRARRAGARARAACSPGACSWSTPSRAASSRTTRSSARSPAAGRTAAGSTRNVFDLRRASPTVPPPPRCAGDELDRAAARLRLHRRGPRGCCSRRWPRTARSRSARWAPTRRWRCCSDQRAVAVQLLPPALRAGDQPADRSDPRGAGDVAGTSIGPDGNTFEETPEQCHRLALPGADPRPTSSWRELAAIATRACSSRRARRPLYRRWRRAPTALERAVERLCAAAVEAVDEGYNILILSRPRRGRERAPRSRRCSRCRAVHQHLVRDGIRMHTGLVVETGEAREVHHFALLIGYGAAAVNPYLALDTVRELVDRRELPRLGATTRAALHQGDRRGPAQGDVQDGHLHAAVVPRRADLRGGRARPRADRAALHRHAVAARGRRPAELGREVRERHARGFGRRPIAVADELPVGGQYQWRRRGERHKWNPATIAKLQDGGRARTTAALFAEYARAGDDEDERPVHAARPARAATDARDAGAARRGRAGDRDRQALRHRRDVLRLDQRRGARDAGDRDEPHRRALQQRRGRRGAAPLRAGRRTATRGAARSSRWPRRASASPPSTWSTPTSCRSRSPRAPSPARAASCPATRSTSASPRCAGRRRA